MEKKSKILLISRAILAGSFSILVSAQADYGANNLAEPDPNRLKEIVFYLCNDECAGRMTGEEGERLAGNFLAGYYQNAGLSGLTAKGSPSIYHQGWKFQPSKNVEHWVGKGIPVPGHWWNFHQEALPKAISYNIGGILPGTDPELKNEYIVLMAHYDHLGKSDQGIFRGADDNASGTAAVVEVAYCLKDYAPRRSIVFLNTSGEEVDHLGAEAFLKHGPIPASAIKGTINLDMVGRNGGGFLQVGPAKTRGKVASLTRDARQLSPSHGITLRAGIEEYVDSSDHYHFFKRRIPTVYFHTGVHEDYHTVKDTPEKLDYGKLVQVVKIVRDLIRKIADDDHSPSMVHTSEWSQWDWPKDKVLEGALHIIP